ncbi:MAG: SDR family NAD(P)-dependent oxidoreductase [Hyphomicrobiales bacterium]
MTAPDFSLAKKAIVVTGAGRGLGKAIAEGLAALGASVIVAGRTAEDVSAVARGINDSGGTAIDVVFDAQDAGDVDNVVSTAVARFGRLDGIVVNHGVTLHSAAYETAPDAFRRVIDINLTSCFLCARAAGRRLRDQGKGGSIVLISSNASFLAYDGLVAYGASKGGVDQLCRQLGAEWGPDRIRVNAIGPGYMNSHMRGVENAYEDPAFKKELMQNIPLRRRGDPDELVGAAAFFLSEASSYVTGQYLAIDGGFSLF